MLGKMQMNKALIRLTSKQFEAWFTSKPQWKSLDWRVYYRQIGGKVHKNAD